MPCRFELLADPRLLVLRQEGHIEPRELQVTFDALRTLQGYHPGLNRLLDFAAATSSATTLDDLLSRRKFHRMTLAEVAHTVRWSYYAPTDLAFGLCRRAQIMFDDIPNLQTGVFRMPEEALAFVGLTPQDLPDWPG